MTNTINNPTPPTLDMWATVEMMGHRIERGRITEVLIAGVPMLQIETPATETGPAKVALITPASVYCINVSNEEAIRTAIARFAPRPALSPGFAQHAYEDDGDLDEDDF